MGFTPWGSGGTSGTITGVRRLVEDYGVSLTATAAANSTAIQQAFSDVTTPGSAYLGFSLYLHGNPAGMPYPVNTLTLPSEPVHLYGDSPVLSVLGTTSGTLLTYSPTTSPLNTATSPWANNNTSITSAIHYRSNSWDIENIGFTKTDNWSGNSGDLVAFPTWNPATQNSLVVHLVNVLITNANGNGLNLAINGIRAENRLHMVGADGCANTGLIIPSDTIATNIAGNNCNEEGILCNGTNGTLTGFKCYNNGGGAVAGRTSGLTIVNGNGGFVATNGYLQDNYGPGVTIHNGQNVVVQAVVDRNCWNGGTVDSTKQAGFVLNGGYGCILDITATDTYTGTKPNGQLHGILVQATDGTNTAFTANQKNIIKVVQTQSLGASATVLATIDPNSVLDGCVVTSDGALLQRAKTVNAPGATPTMNTALFDLCTFTGLAAAITSMTTNLSNAEPDGTGAPVAGQRFEVSLTDNGTARAITWGASFEASTVALPTTTVINARLDVLFVWNPATSKWRCERVS